MISAFEEAGRGVAAPVELLTRSGRGVSPLEFFAVSEGGGEGLAAGGAAAVMGAEVAAAEERAGQMRAMVDAARHEAAAEVRREMEEKMDARLAVERERVDTMRRQFATDRERYFGAAEGQVVRLALLVARRVLAREVTGDGMHLAATVRAALARVQEGSATVLRVPGPEVSAWRVMFAAGVEVVGDAEMEAGTCVLETNVGRVELGVEVQMGEIERGFGELLRRQGE